MSKPMQLYALNLRSLLYVNYLNKIALKKRRKKQTRSFDIQEDFLSKN